jgi:phage tail-like protein
MPTSRNDPYPGHNFLVEIEGIARSGFLSVEGIEACVEVSEYREGNDMVSTPRKIPGLRKFSNITLKRGLVQDASLWNWFHNILNGQLERRPGSITVLNEDRNPVVRFIFREAWPCRLKYGCLDALENGVMIEELELAVESIEVEFI